MAGRGAGIVFTFSAVGVGGVRSNAVRSVRVVMIGEDAEHALEVAPVDDPQPVEALGAGGADEAFGERVRFRRP
jgi:hypothetical protein